MERRDQNPFATVLDPRLHREAWAVVWKGDGRSVRDFLLTFGLSASAEEAMSKVEQRLENDPRFRRRASGGVFYPLALHLNVPVPPQADRARGRS